MKNLFNKSKRNKIVMGLTGVVLFIGLSSSTINRMVGEWIAPASADKIINPVKSTDVSIKNGKVLYKKNCVACHGVKGKGDGIAGASLTPSPANFWTDKFQSQSDGAVYWKLSEGKGVMVSFKNSIKENDRWDIVNFLKSLKK